ncbi:MULTISPECIES: hypothetical protein [Streptomyces]|nr:MULTISPECIES: hypothetical protein [Streptomyces]MDF9807440.1 hypothetical protein [Streptomyces sp. HB372]WSC64837.1 hypothetical protein OHA57_30535 [Streptomyces anulatus]WSR79189.1 hypothetical protein OG274_29765 [Streptomyces anulatus]WTC62425.1 hypothetical protein OG865_07790 [Streptomyces anulatus]WTC74553.1 hypothetical protein OG882_31135 [Streptomyces anulatus]
MPENQSQEPTEAEDFEVVAHSEDGEDEAGVCVTNNSDMLQ